MRGYAALFARRAKRNYSGQGAVRRKRGLYPFSVRRLSQALFCKA
jgi:hypothetical protein